MTKLHCNSIICVSGLPILYYSLNFHSLLLSLALLLYFFFSLLPLHSRSLRHNCFLLHLLFTHACCCFLHSYIHSRMQNTSTATICSSRLPCILPFVSVHGFCHLLLALGVQTASLLCFIQTINFPSSQ